MSSGLSLYKHNLVAADKVKKSYENGEKIVGIVHATGTGKTYIALDLLLQYKKEKKIYFVPTIGVINHIKEVIENSGLSLKKDFPNLKFRTYQSLCNLSSEELKNIEADLIILDEFHHIGAPIWGNRINEIIKNHPDVKVFGMTAYTVRDRGTPYERDMANSNGNELFSNKIVSYYDLANAMIDKALPVPIYRSAYAHLEGILKELEERINNNEYTKEELANYLKLIDAVKKRIHEAPSDEELIRNNIKPNGKYIYFCPPGAEKGVNDIQTIMDEVKKWLVGYDVEFYQTTSELGDLGFANQKAFYTDVDLNGNSTKNKIRIMFAINQYNEGIHAPNVDGVILGRGTESDIVFFEQIGRTLNVRNYSYDEYNKYNDLSLDKLIALAKSRDIEISDTDTKNIIINKLLAPVIIDLANNIDFIRNLENDIKDRLKQAQQKKPNPEKRSIKILPVPFDIEVLNEDLYQELLKLRERINGDNWDKYYQLASEYYKEKTFLNVPYSYNVNSDGVNYKLGYWIKKQRNLFINGKMPEERFYLLEKIGMIWINERYPSVFKMSDKEVIFEYANAYFSEKNDLRIPYQYSVHDSFNQRTVFLGRGMEYIKYLYINGLLSEEEIEKWESIGIDWDYHPKIILTWNEKYEAVKNHFNGNLKQIVNNDSCYDDGVLIIISSFLDDCRQLYFSGKLEENKIKLLEDIGMVWNYNIGWDECFELFKSSKNEENNYKYYYYIGRKLKLDKWENEQRKLYAEGKLEESKISLLREAGFDFKEENIEFEDNNGKSSISNEEQKWYWLYALAKKFYLENGHLLIPDDYNVKIYGETYYLGLWIKKQRKAFIRGNMPKDKFYLLEKVDMRWLDGDSFNFKMSEKYVIFELAKIYFREKENLKVSFDYSLNIDAHNTYLLAVCMSKVKGLYKNGLLSEEEIKKWESIGLNFNQSSTVYSSMHNEIEAILKYFDGYLLGKGIKYIQCLYKNGLLSEEEIEKWESIGIDWDCQASKSHTWYEEYEAIKNHFNGDLKLIGVGPVCEYNGISIQVDKFISKCRKQYINNQLQPDKIKLLEDIGMIWSNEITWEEYFELFKFVNNASHIEHNPVQYIGRKVELDKWENEQRKLYAEDKLEVSKINLLKEAGFDFKEDEKIVIDVDIDINSLSKEEQMWYKYYGLAKRFYKNNGHLVIPNHYSIEVYGDKYSLTKWVCAQRRNYYELSEEKIKLLEDIGMIWNITQMRSDIYYLCKNNNIPTTNDNITFLLKIPYKVLLSKIKYLEDNGLPIVINQELNEIFYMSDINMKVNYGISVEELLDRYYPKINRGM